MLYMPVPQPVGYQKADVRNRAGDMRRMDHEAEIAALSAALEDAGFGNRRNAGGATNDHKVRGRRQLRSLQVHVPPSPSGTKCIY